MAVLGHPAAIGRELRDPVMRVDFTFGSSFLPFAGDGSFKCHSEYLLHVIAEDLLGLCESFNVPVHCF